MIALFKDVNHAWTGLPDMIRLTNESNLSDTLHITSNDHCWIILCQKLIESGLKDIRFSIYGVDDGSYKIFNMKKLKKIFEFWSVNKSCDYLSGNLKSWIFIQTNKIEKV